MPIRHVVVLMLENRSFDSMLGKLYESSPGFDGLSGDEANFWHRLPGEAAQKISVWQDPTLTPSTLSLPDPDPGEGFADIQQQIFGNDGTPTMSGFVDNYMIQKPTQPQADPKAVMHYFTPDQVPVISQLARAFGVSDRWHASAPCQTWPNRFFAHTGTAAGYVNNSPTHFPYRMPTVFSALARVGKRWRIYFHDFPQSATLADLWDKELTNFRYFEETFPRDAANGDLPEYSFIEPRYFANPLLGTVPNDGHPPHNVAYGEQLIASVYNAVRSGPNWKNTLLIITYDEHGGCFDHVPPPSATPPDELKPDGFAFDRFGVRVPAVIVSPYVRPGSIIRPRGVTPFDHTSIIATLRRLFDVAPLTARDKAAPDLLDGLSSLPDNQGPAGITAPAIPAAPAQVATAAARAQNDLQASLSAAAIHLPTFGANIATHIERLMGAKDVVSPDRNVGEAAADIGAHIAGFLGRSV